ncbi:MAG: T9SS type A sorting domain-containing protein [Brumimicrobium sp.]|nr:T9SS type A sorting domain-containing protein [Brumimicrobium sp.]MCO5269121.1 T9SS type A sorting domain-containing protein [Brumimicrobium sp.]
MKNLQHYTVTFFLLSFVYMVFPQNTPVNVFDCEAYALQPSQQELDNNSYIYGSCIELGGDHTSAMTANQNKTMKAYQRIHLKSGTHLKSIENGGKNHLLIQEDFGNGSVDVQPGEIGQLTGVSVMNYPDLNHVLRYKKLEFGIGNLQNQAFELWNDVRKFIKNTTDPTAPYDPTALNPFLAWDIQVQAIFNCLDVPWYEIVEGYFTRDYVENESENAWNEIKGNDGVMSAFPFRVRFAPPQNGKWYGKIQIKVKGVLKYESPLFYFYVVESGDPGYVHIHENRRNLKLGSRMIFPVGQNFPAPSDENCNERHWEIIPHTEDCATLEEWDEYLQKVETYFAYGNQYGDPAKPKYFRMVSCPWSNSIEFEKKGNYYKRLHYAYEIDKLLDLCEDYNGLMIYNLMMQDHFMYRNFWWQWSWEHKNEDGTHIDYAGPNSNYPFYCYNDDPWVNGGSKTPDKMFTNTTDLLYHKQRTRYLIARYGYSTKIAEWELLSEPWHLNSHLNDEDNIPYNFPNAYPEVRDAIYNYQKVMISYIKDSLNWNRQLIGINIKPPEAEKTGNHLDSSIYIQNVDVIGFNPYYVVPNALLKSESNNMYLTDVGSVRILRAFKNLPGVPVIISEGGIDNVYSPCSNYNLRPVDEMTLGFTGIAGFLFWDGRGKNADSINNLYLSLWKKTFRALNHMNGDDVIGTLSQGWGQWNHYSSSIVPKSKKYEIELQSYISNNKTKAVGYIKNNTYNIKTRGGESDPCKNVPLEKKHKDPYSKQWNMPLFNKRLRIEDLDSKTDYKIEWYSTFGSYPNGYIKSDCQKTNKKKGKWGITLEHPKLTVSYAGNNDLPVVWFVIHKGSCSNSMNIPDSNSEELLTNKNITKNAISSSKESLVKVYPNPFDNKITIESSVEDLVNLESLEGKVLDSWKIPSNSYEIHISNLQKGIYILRFINQNIIFKLIKL